MKKVIYGTVCIILALIGVLLAVKFLSPLLEGKPAYMYYGIYAGVAFVMALIGLVLAPPLIRFMERVTEKVVKLFSAMSAADILGRTMGLISGLIIASLLGSAVARIEIVGPYITILLVLLMGYTGWRVGAKVGGDIINFRFGKGARPHKPEGEEEGAAPAEEEGETLSAAPKVLDTSVIIDGRIADIYRTGFLEGDLIVPNFVLEELRHIADSSDNLKRNRGRGGLDTLNRMREQFDPHIVITEQDYPRIAEVDSKLVRLAQDLGGLVVTNDFNLNKVARLQGVRVLNINELANAVKPIVLPGEEMSAQVIKEGKEAGQGIAYLDDGTMIVVENGVKYVGLTIFVVVTSILQTAAGRMVFARPKLDKKGNVIEIRQDNAR